MKIYPLLAALLFAAVVACQPAGKVQNTESGLNPQKFKMEVNGKHTDLYVLKNSNGMEVCVTNFGGRIVSVMVPDKNNVKRDIVLGFDSIQDYIKYPSDFGATIGRYANRIAQGRFTLDGKEYQLPQNNFGHCLHGGPKGFQYQIFDAEQVNEHELHLKYLSKDGEEGFPGNLKVALKMILTENNAIDIQYSAQTDRPTIINMTNHSYFNLDGNPGTNNNGYMLSVNADHFTPVDSTFMTTGEILPVENTPMDLRTPQLLGQVYSRSFEQLKFGHGVDHNWVLNTKGDITKPCATLSSPKTGITLKVYTTEPGIQIYTGNFLDGSFPGKKGIVYDYRASVCLETQKYPDTPNKSEWPSCVLRPGEKYSSRCIYQFTNDGI